MLTLQFIPYSEIEHLSSNSRIQKILNIIKEEAIVLLEGRLKKNEETDLIKRTMEEIGENEDYNFKGIELSVIQPCQKNSDFLRSLRVKFINMLLGDRQGLTVMGPASLVREIKQDPEKLQLFIDNYTTRKINVSENKKDKKATTNNNSSGSRNKKRKSKHSLKRK